jgi:hypothetical protein
MAVLIIALFVAVGLGLGLALGLVAGREPLPAARLRQLCGIGAKVGLVFGVRPYLDALKPGAFTPGAQFG